MKERIYKMVISILIVLSLVDVCEQTHTGNGTADAGCSNDCLNLGYCYENLQRGLHSCVCTKQSQLCVLEAEGCFSGQSSCTDIQSGNNIYGYSLNSMRCVCTDHCQFDWSVLSQFIQTAGSILSSTRPKSGQYSHWSHLYICVTDCSKIDVGLVQEICLTTDTNPFCNINACVHGVCQNGTCVVDSNGYWCECEDGYAGTNCEIDINECTSQPCQNGGSCTDLINKYNCTCIQGYTGNNCEIEINECSSQPCQNGGSCTNLINKYNCTCSQGYTGNNCEIEINECSSQPCQNGGSCTNLINKYNCTCSQGYTGNNCEIEINACINGPCQNGGTCTTSKNDYVCTCIPGYNGSNCEIAINFCANQPCQNGGSCESVLNDYNCTCTQGYTGKSCETAMCECDCAYKQRILVLNTESTMSIEELEEELLPVVTEIKQNLTVDKKELSSTVRKKTCAPDKRKSSQGIGFLGIVFLCIVFASIVGPDLINLGQNFGSVKAFFKRLLK